MTIIIFVQNVWGDYYNVQNTHEIKRTLFNWTKQNKTCINFYASYVQHKNRRRKKHTKQLLQLILCQLDVGGWRKEKVMRLTDSIIIVVKNLWGEHGGHRLGFSRGVLIVTF